MSTGSFKVVFAADTIERRGDEFAKRLAATVGSEYTNDVKQRMINSPRTGENVNFRGQQRSAPGEPPAPEHGDLVRQTRFTVRKTPLGWIAECGNTLKKALWLEYGTERMQPRPVWGPALQALRQRIPQIIQELREKQGGRRGRS